MEDAEIMELYFSRSQDAVRQTEKKYGAFCRAIAENILRSREDSEECVGDTWLRAWQTIPPKRPESLRAYLACLTRSAAISRWRRDRAKKRGGADYLRSLDELGDCILAADNAAAVVDTIALRQVLDRFLTSLRPVDRRVFLQRYWYFCSVQQIAADNGLGQSAVKTSLHRSREKLRQLLEQEGISL